MKGNKYIFFIIGLILFLISPLLALPFIFAIVYERRIGSLLLLSMFLGYVSYMIVPTPAMDLSRYYEYYELISDFSLDDFFVYLWNKPDKLYYSFMFVFSRLDLNFQFFLFLFSTFNYYIVFSLFTTIFEDKKLNKKSYFIALLFVLLSFGYLNYFVSSRFTIALSFLILSVKYLFLDQKKKVVIFYILSFLTHIAFFLFLPLIFFLIWFKDRVKIIGVITFMVVIIAIIPSEILISFLFNESFSDKANVYIQAEKRVASLYPQMSYFLLFIVLLISYSSLIKIKTIDPFVSRIVFIYSLGLMSILLTLSQGFIVVDRFFIIFKSVFTILFLYLVYFYNIDKTNIMRILLLASLMIYVWYSFIIYNGCFNNISNTDYLFTKDILRLKYTSDMFR